MEDSTSTDAQWKDHWPSFAKALGEKLHRGWMQYGDESFDLKPSRLISELQEEALDIAGWGMILWVRLKALDQDLKEISSACTCGHSNSDHDQVDSVARNCARCGKKVTGKTGMG